MKILIDILHPAHVHFFKNFHAVMRERGHELLITARAKEFSIDLLERYGLTYHQISTQKAGNFGLARELVRRTFRLSKIVRKFRPDVMTGIMGPSIALAGAFHRVPAVVFYDTEFASQTNWFTYPLAHSVCTPDCYRGRVRGRHVEYPGYHELAYLHPRRFTPNSEHLADFGLKPGDHYSLVRFVSWEAVHDRTEVGLSLEQKLRLVELLKGHGGVILSSEAPLPPDLEPLRARGPVEHIHHLIAFAQVVVGESATMSSEAAVLGVPAVFIATTGRGYTDDQEARYGLVRHFKEAQFEDAAAELDNLLSDDPRIFGAQARARLLDDKIDVTDWMVDYFESSFGEGAEKSAA